MVSMEDNHAPAHMRTSRAAMQKARRRAKLAPVSASEPRQIATRIRARITEMGTSESALAESLGKHRSVLSTILRRLEKGGNIRSDTLTTLERALGKSQQWILTGEEGEGIRLSDLPAWAAVAEEALDRYRVSADALDAVGKMRIPATPKRFDAAFVSALARAWSDAT